MHLSHAVPTIKQSIHRNNHIELNALLSTYGLKLNELQYKNKTRALQSQSKYKWPLD